jgi:hypothetical protein
MSAKLGDDTRELALAALRDICGNPDAPAAARAQAARTLLEIDGSLGKHALPPIKPGNKPLAELSREEMAAELQALRTSRAAELT